MTSLPGKCQPPDNSATRGPTKIRRRVQWASNHDTRAISHPECSPQWSVHELDELGLDPSAFETLRSALEKHQFGENLGGGLRVQEQCTLPPIQGPLVAPLHASVSTLSPRDTPYTSSPVALSDYPLSPMSSDNPYFITSTPQAQASEAVQSLIQSLPTVDEFSVHLSSSTLVTRRSPGAPGEAWIDPLEREASPLQAPIPDIGGQGDPRSAFGRGPTWRQGNSDCQASFREDHIEPLVEHRATEAAKAHTGRSWGWFHRSLSGEKALKGVDEKGQATHHHHSHSDTVNDTSSTDGDTHHPGWMHKGSPGNWLGTAIHARGRQRHLKDRCSGQPHAPKLGNGVLSTLLALYVQNYDDERSMSGESISSNVEYEDDVVLKPRRSRLSHQGDNHDQPTPGGQKGAEDQYPGKFNLGRTLKGGSASSILAHIRPPTLPTASATAALIVGAGALSGVAAPHHVKLAPNLKRPGYNLVRYSVEEFPNVVPRTSSIISRGLRRAYSVDSDIATAGHRVSEENTDEVEPLSTPGASAVAFPTAGSEGVVPRPRRGQTYPPTPRGRKVWAGRPKEIALPMHLSPTRLRLLLSPHPIVTMGLDTPGGSGYATPTTVSAGRTPVDELGEKRCHFDLRRVERETQRIEERERKERQKQREKEMRRKRRQAEVYITRHVAEILQRQEFIMKLARAMIMFGGPSHRLASQIQSTGRVLDLELSCMYLPDVMLISFEDSATGTSNVKFIRQGSALDLEKLQDAHSLYWEVIHDNMSVSAASASLDVLMRKKPLYNIVQLTIIGAMCSASICSISFSGSFIDCLVSAPLGGLLVAIQLIAVRNELYAHVFEITIATLLSFLSAALASTRYFCYSAVASSSVVLILPGYIVLTGSLELSSRSLVAGAVRVCFAVMYSLFLGFGLAIGVELYQNIVGQPIIGPTDYACVASHDPVGPWWQQTPSLWWAFLTVPMYSLFLSMRLMAPWWRKEMVLCIAIASTGWLTNHFVGTKFPHPSDISAACGAFVVGFVSNIYGRFFNGNAFIVMITGILFQVPSGLGKGGLLDFASDQMQGSSTFVSGFHTAAQLISVALGLTVGLAVSLVVVHPVQSRRRAGGLFSL